MKSERAAGTIEALNKLVVSAIKDPAPYPSWPGDMRRKIGVDYRDVTFTFLYY